MASLLSLTNTVVVQKSYNECIDFINQKCSWQQTCDTDNLVFLNSTEIKHDYGILLSLYLPYQSIFTLSRIACCCLLNGMKDVVCICSAIIAYNYITSCLCECCYVREPSAKISATCKSLLIQTLAGTCTLYLPYCIQLHTCTHHDLWQDWLHSFIIAKSSSDNSECHLIFAIYFYMLKLVNTMSWHVFMILGWLISHYGTSVYLVCES